MQNTIALIMVRHTEVRGFCNPASHAPLYPDEQELKDTNALEKETESVPRAASSRFPRAQGSAPPMGQFPQPLEVKRGPYTWK